MKNLKSSLFLLFIIINLNQLFAQCQIGLISTIHYGNLNNSDFDYFDSNTNLSIGVIGRKQLNSKVYISGVLAYQKVGWYALDFKHGSEEQNIDLYWKGKSLNVSTDVGYHIINTDKFQFGSSIGLKLGIMLDEEFDIEERKEGFITEYYTKRQFLPSVEFNLDLMYKLSNNFTLNLRPNWNQFFHFDSNNYQERNLGLGLILLYTINC